MQKLPSVLALNIDPSSGHNLVSQALKADNNLLLKSDVLRGCCCGESFWTTDGVLGVMISCYCGW